MFLITGSCKEGDDADGPAGTDYYMEFERNGTAVRYASASMGNVQATHNEIGSTGEYATNFVGLQELFAVSTNNVTALVIDTVPVSVGQVYTNRTVPRSDEVSAKVVTVGYFDAAGVFYTSLDVSLIFGITPSARIEITAVNDEVLEAEFSGTLYNADYTDSLVFRNGKVRAERF
ncbi:MAG: hypothetical protein GC205_02550 [Bacteroidetes bacterium]|nr:hypothetical protein [Bacteroidota bacterium]